MQFDDLIESGPAGFLTLVKDRVEETPQLEFKVKRHPDNLDLDKEDKRALGEALSGFANAIGGTLVIGVATDRPEGLDRASKLCPIRNVEKVADRYRSYVTECVNPAITGVRVAAVTSDGDAGYIVIAVPRGNSRPHMSMAPNHTRYYRRVADTFVPMLHYEVEEMMRLKTAPDLRLLLRFQSGGSIGGHRKYYLQFGLRNVSGTSAKYPYIGARVFTAGPRLADYGLDGNGRNLWTRMALSAPAETLFAGGADAVVHPAQSLFVSRFEYMASGRPDMSYWLASELQESDSVAIHFSFGCEDLPRRTAELHLTKSQLVNGNPPSPHNWGLFEFLPTI